MEKPSGTGKKIIILSAILLLVPLMILLFGKGMKHQFGTLPYFYPVDVQKKLVDGKTVSDTTWHTIPQFELTDQEGNKIDRSYMEGKVCVVDFFFTTCGTICPKMTRQMSQLSWLLEDIYFDDVVYLSITVNPEYDSPEVMKKYAIDMEADLSRWAFATGPQDIIYPLGVDGFKLTTQEDLAAEGGFLHSEKFVLVDKNLHIRGYYDGTTVEGRQLIEDDIKMLIGEERRLNKTKD